MNAALQRMAVVGLLCSLVACTTEPQRATPQYHGDVAPLLASHCVSCHSEGGIAPFALTTYDQVKLWAPGIAQTTANRTMPPWLADNSGECNTYRDSNWLTDSEIATIDAWVKAGAVAGDPPATPPVPATPEHLGEDALQIDPGVSYTPDDDLSDDYRCFVIDPGVTSDVLMTAYEVVPGDARSVHHVILYAIDTEEAQAQVDRLDANAEGAGYSCFGGPGTAQMRILAGWAPGSGVTRLPEGTGLALHAGRKAVMQVHYNLSAGARADRTKIRLQLGTGAQEGFTFLVADLSMRVPAGQAAAPHEFSVRPAQLGIPQGLFLRGVFPHMHKLGQTLHAELRGEGQNVCVTDVKHWDFAWQRFYFFDEPLYVYPNDSLTVRCTYDTRGRQDEVRWGEGTSDEMCLLGVFFTAF